LASAAAKTVEAVQGAGGSAPAPPQPNAFLAKPRVEILAPHVPQAIEAVQGAGGSASAPSLASPAMDIFSRLASDLDTEVHTAPNSEWFLDLLLVCAPVPAAVFVSDPMPEVLN